MQRLITAQIRQSNGIQNPVDSYAGQVGYNVAPWVNWAPQAFFREKWEIGKC